MALPDPKTLQYADLESGPFVNVASSRNVNVSRLNNAHLITGPFFGYEPPITATEKFYCIIVV